MPEGPNAYPPPRRAPEEETPTAIHGRLPAVERSLRMELVMGSAAFVFGLGTALLYGRGPERTRRSAETGTPEPA